MREAELLPEAIDCLANAVVALDDIVRALGARQTEETFLRLQASLPALGVLRGPGRQANHDGSADQAQGQ